MENEKIISSILEHKIDLGTMPRLEIDKQVFIEIPESISFVPFHSSNYSLLTSVHSPLAQFQTISMATVVKYPIILCATSDFTNDLFYQLIRKYSDNPEIIWTDSIALQNQMVRDNIGNSLFPWNMPLPEANFSKIPLTNNILISVGFLIPTEEPDTPLRNLFILKTKNLLAENS